MLKNESTSESTSVCYQFYPIKLKPFWLFYSVWTAYRTTWYATIVLKRQILRIKQSIAPKIRHEHDAHLVIRWLLHQKTTSTGALIGRMFPWFWIALSFDLKTSFNLIYNQNKISSWRMDNVIYLLDHRLLGLHDTITTSEAQITVDRCCSRNRNRRIDA